MTAVRTRETTSRPRKRDLTMGCFSRSHYGLFLQVERSGRVGGMYGCD